MQFIVGIAMLVVGIGALLVARPRNGTPRSFVGTGLEIPIVITLVTAIGIGTVLTVGGIAELLM